MSVYLLWGDDDFRLEKDLFSLRKKILPDDISPLNYRKLEEPAPHILLENLQTTGMMFGNLLIEVHSTKLFLRGADDSENKKEFVLKLLDTLEFLPESVNVIFVCKIAKKTDKKIDGASKIVKEMKKFAEIQQYQAFKPWDKKNIIPWIISTAKEKNLTIHQDTARELFEGAGGELRILDNELNKLELLAYPNKTISKELIKKLHLNNENIFLLEEAWLTGNKEQSYKEIKKLCEADEPQRILMFLQNTLTRWIKIKHLSKNFPSFEISKRLGITEQKATIEISKLKSHSIEKLMTMKKRLTDTENSIKTGKLPAELALELVL